MSTECENLSVVFEDFSEVDPRQIESHSAFVNWFCKQLSQIDTYGSVDKRVVVDAPFSIRTTDERSIYFHTIHSDIKLIVIM